MIQLRLEKYVIIIEIEDYDPEVSHTVGVIVIAFVIEAASHQQKGSSRPVIVHEGHCFTYYQQAILPFGMRNIGTLFEFKVYFSGFINLEVAQLVFEIVRNLKDQVEMIYYDHFTFLPICFIGILSLLCHLSA